MCIVVSGALETNNLRPPLEEKDNRNIKVCQIPQENLSFLQTQREKGNVAWKSFLSKWFLTLIFGSQCCVCSKNSQDSWMFNCQPCSRIKTYTEYNPEMIYTVGIKQTCDQQYHDFWTFIVIKDASGLNSTFTGRVRPFEVHWHWCHTGKVMKTDHNGNKL